MYGYVLGDPINWVDANGQFGLPDAAVGGIIGGVSGAIGAWSTGGEIGDIVTAAAIGAGSGAVSGFFSPSSLIGQIAYGAALGGFTNIGGQVIGKIQNPCRKFNVGSVIGSMIGGGLAAGKVNILGGAGKTVFGQVSSAFSGGIPSLAGSAIGTGIGQF